MINRTQICCFPSCYPFGSSQASDFGKILLYVRSVLWDLGIPQNAASVLYEDNDPCTAMAMAMAQKPTPCTQYMDIKFQVICEWVQRDLIHLKRIDTTINLADLFTKQLGSTLFYRHLDYIHGHVPPHYVMPSHSSATSDPQTSKSIALTVARLWADIAHNPFGFQLPHG